MRGILCTVFGRVPIGWRVLQRGLALKVTPVLSKQHVLTLPAMGMRCGSVQKTCSFMSVASDVWMASACTPKDNIVSMTLIYSSRHETLVGVA